MANPMQGDADIVRFHENHYYKKSEQAVYYKDCSSEITQIKIDKRFFDERFNIEMQKSSGETILVTVQLIFDLLNCLTGQQKDKVANKTAGLEKLIPLLPGDGSSPINLQTIASIADDFCLWKQQDDMYILMEEESDIEDNKILYNHEDNLIQIQQPERKKDIFIRCKSNESQHQFNVFGLETRQLDKLSSLAEILNDIKTEGKLTEIQETILAQLLGVIFNSESKTYEEDPDTKSIFVREMAKDIFTRMSGQQNKSPSNKEPQETAGNDTMFGSFLAKVGDNLDNGTRPPANPSRQMIEETYQKDVTPHDMKKEYTLKGMSSYKEELKYIYKIRIDIDKGEIRCYETGKTPESAPDKYLIDSNSNNIVKISQSFLNSINNRGNGSRTIHPDMRRAIEEDINKPSRTAAQAPDGGSFSPDNTQHCLTGGVYSINTFQESFTLSSISGRPYDLSGTDKEDEEVANIMRRNSTGPNSNGSTTPPLIGSSDDERDTPNGTMREATAQQSRASSIDMVDE